MTGWFVFDVLPSALSQVLTRATVEEYPWTVLILSIISWIVVGAVFGSLLSTFEGKGGRARFAAATTGGTVGIPLTFIVLIMMVEACDYGLFGFSTKTAGLAAAVDMFIATFIPVMLAMAMAANVAAFAYRRTRTHTNQS